MATLNPAPKKAPQDMGGSAAAKNVKRNAVKNKSTTGGDVKSRMVVTKFKC